MMDFRSRAAGSAGSPRIGRRGALAAALLGSLLGGGAQARPQSPADAAQQACSSLRGLDIAPSAIALRTSGGKVVEAAMVGPATGPMAHGDYCRVVGRLHPVDPAAPDIVFHLALPSAWNGKAVMLGGGGFDGSFFVNEVTTTILNAPPDAPTPLARGYAVFASDGGHQSTSPVPMTDGTFASNAEAFRNWAGDALKKTRDAALVVIRSRYGRTPRRAYFLGASTGGREALQVAGLWPDDWDGVVALYPARDMMVQAIGQLAVVQALSVPGAYPDRAKRGVLFRAALAACDRLDGLSDGVIGNVRGCRAAFDPATALLDGRPVRCPGGGDRGETCLSDAQIAALRRIDAPAPTDARLTGGITRHPGYNVFTSDSGSDAASADENAVAGLALGSAPPHFPSRPTDSFPNQFADNIARYILAQDAAANPLAIDPGHFGPLAARVEALSAQDTADHDLTRFAARGSKLLLMHGTDDILISPRVTEAYVARMKASQGSARVDGFLRFYEVPAFGHSQSAVFKPGWDSLTALEQWVERGVDPAGNQVIVDLAGVPGRTRPLCLYPSWPKYDGRGPVNEAGSFRCATD